MSIKTRDKVILSLDGKSYIHYNEGLRKFYLYVNNVKVWESNETTFTFSAALAMAAGLAAGGGFTASPRLCHTGGVPATQTTDGTDATPIVTETYLAEVFVPCNMTITGLAFFNGSAVAGNLFGILYDSTGAVVGQTASTAASGTDAYQRIPLVTPYAAKGPATYYVGLQCNNVAQRYNTHILGSFGAAKKTGEVFGTPTTITPPTTFTTALGPIASLY